MPIVALSESAAHAISSTLVLNDAISVIKELIDNALDSHASNVTIEISANTLDIIQVKDNGGGIGVEDRQLLCKRGFTSKIRTLEDLYQLGGTFLGFRGEALSSIVNLSDSITFTTRVDGETVGTLLKFDSHGKLTSSSSAAHGTGTTVRVSDFLKSIPVRKQTALKQATKTLNNIKRLLFDYAFARPTVRFQFKVLKSGGDLKANWSFAPCSDASNLNVLASKIVGKDVAAQCKQFVVTSEDGGYTIDGLLFARDSDISRCGANERFISVDGRPLAVERGLLGDVNKIYKSYISSMLSEGTSIPNKIFLLLRLQCPRGSYDVNIEPAKNEVMFEDSALVLDLFERLCKMAYGEREPQQKTRSDPVKKRADKVIDFNILLATTTPTKPTQEGQDSDTKSSDIPEQVEYSTPTPEQTKQTKVFTNMFDVDDEELLTLQGSEPSQRVPEQLDESEDIMDPKVFNPFVLAKVNALQKHPDSLSRAELTLTPAPAAAMDSIQSLERDNAASRQVSRRSDLLPSPSPSPERNIPYQNPGPPNRPWKSRQIRSEIDEDEISSPGTSARPVESTKPTLLDKWATTMNSSSPQRPADLVEIRRSDPIVIHTRQTMGPTEIATRGKSPSKRSLGVSSGQQPAFRTPFRKSSDSQSSSPMSFDRSTDASRRSPVHPSEPISPADTTSAQFPGFERPRVSLDSELHDIMDFEHRKRSTVLEHRRRARQSKAQSASAEGDNAEEGSAFSVPARPEKEGLLPVGQDASYGSKFGREEDAEDDIPPQPNSSGYTQNPHSNRFKKAIQDLEQRRLKNDVAVSNPEVSDSDEPDENDNRTGVSGKAQHEKKLKMSPKDPRACLIRHLKGKDVQGHASGLKKMSTAKLPFETIGSGLGTYTLVRVVDAEDMVGIDEISLRTGKLSKFDSYVRTGHIFSDMTEGTISQDTMQDLECKVRKLLRAADIV